MKTLLLAILAVCIASTSLAANAKELKRLKKLHSVYDQGKAYKNYDTVAILGANVRFRIAAKQSNATSWKKEVFVKFSAIATLEGINDELFQEIADEYHKMLVERFEKLGLTVLPYSAIEATTAYAALKAKGKTSTMHSKKNWGVAKVFSGEQTPFITFNPVLPFGPHAKVAKELNAILFNSVVTLDFSHIGIKITQSGESNYNKTRRTIYTEGKSSIVPALHIDGHTYGNNLMPRYEDNTYSASVLPRGLHLLQIDLKPSEIESPVNFAISAESCKRCPLNFKSGSFIKSSNLDTVVITADPESYKEAALDLLNQYLDQAFALYQAQKG